MSDQQQAGGVNPMGMTQKMMGQMNSEGMMPMQMCMNMCMDMCKMMTGPGTQAPEAVPATIEKDDQETRGSK